MPDGAGPPGPCAEASTEAVNTTDSANASGRRLRRRPGPTAAFAPHAETGQAPPVVKPPLDLPAIAKALEDAGMEPDDARAAALRVRAGATANPPGYHLDIRNRKLRNELIEAVAGTGKNIDRSEGRILERFSEIDRRHIDAVGRHLDAVEYRLGKRLAKLVWKLFAALVAILATAAAALRYLG